MLEFWASQVVVGVKKLPANAETQVTRAQPMGRRDCPGGEKSNPL